MMIDRTDDDPAAVLAEDDRLRAEAAEAAAQLITKSNELAIAGRDGLVFRRQDDARPDSAGHVRSPVLEEGASGDSADVCEACGIDGYTALLLASIGDAIGLARSEDRRERQAAEDRLCERITDLEEQLKTLTADYQHAQARLVVAEAKIAKRVASLERRTKFLAKALPDKGTQIAAVETQVTALAEAIASEPSARDLDNRLQYLEALMGTAFPAAARSRG